MEAPSPSLPASDGAAPSAMMLEMVRNLSLSLTPTLTLTLTPTITLTPTPTPTPTPTLTLTRCGLLLVSGDGDYAHMLSRLRQVVVVTLARSNLDSIC